MTESRDEVCCRICGCSDEELVAPCDCQGSMRFVHENCLKKWLLTRQRRSNEITMNFNGEICEVCGYHFTFEAVYRPEAPAHISILELSLWLVREFLLRLTSITSFIAKCWMWIWIFPWLSAFIFFTFLDFIQQPEDEAAIIAYGREHLFFQNLLFPGFSVSRVIPGFLCALTGIAVINLWADFATETAETGEPSEGERSPIARIRAELRDIPRTEVDFIFADEFLNRQRVVENQDADDFYTILLDYMDPLLMLIVGSYAAAVGSIIFMIIPGFIGSFILLSVVGFSGSSLFSVSLWADLLVIGIGWVPIILTLTLIWVYRSPINFRALTGRISENLLINCLQVLPSTVAGFGIFTLVKYLFGARIIPKLFLINTVLPIFFGTWFINSPFRWFLSSIIESPETDSSSRFIFLLRGHELDSPSSEWRNELNRQRYLTITNITDALVRSIMPLFFLLCSVYPALTGLKYIEILPLRYGSLSHDEPGLSKGPQLLHDAGIERFTIPLEIVLLHFVIPLVARMPIEFSGWSEFVQSKFRRAWREIIAANVGFHVRVLSAALTFMVFIGGLGVLSIWVMIGLPLFFGRFVIFFDDGLAYLIGVSLIMGLIHLSIIAYSSLSPTVDERNVVLESSGGQWSGFLPPTSPLSIRSPEIERPSLILQIFVFILCVIIAPLLLGQIFVALLVLPLSTVDWLSRATFGSCWVGGLLILKAAYTVAAAMGEEGTRIVIVIDRLFARQSWNDQTVLKEAIELFYPSIAAWVILVAIPLGIAEIINMINGYFAYLLRRWICCIAFTCILIFQTILPLVMERLEKLRKQIYDDKYLLTSKLKNKSTIISS